ncbi:MAG: histidine kinase [Ignavibacteriae bacterium]|nr:histidine kinase [Ignavibacteriota bacterium]
MKKKYSVLLHTIFWSVTLVSTGLQTIPSIGKESINNIILDYVIYVFSYISMFYSFYFFISNKYLKKEYAKYLIIFGFVFTIFFSVISSLVYIYFLSNELFALNGNGFLLEYSKYFLQFLEVNFIFALSGSLIKIALLWYESMVKQKEIEKQMVSSELALLKTQINPNFLVSALIELKNRTEKSPDTAINIIENLSDIMSYMLYETSADKVLLDKEINYINNYLNLQRVRYNPDLISFEVKGDTNGIYVPPLLFMPFIEDVFKYGEGFSQTPGIIINLDARKSNLFFEIINPIKENSDKSKPEDDFNIKAIKRRLDLLFGNNYSLELNNDGNKYLTKLNMNLTA